MTPTPVSLNLEISGSRAQLSDRERLQRGTPCNSRPASALNNRNSRFSPRNNPVSRVRPASALNHSTKASFNKLSKGRPASAMQRSFDHAPSSNGIVNINSSVGVKKAWGASSGQANVPKLSASVFSFPERPEEPESRKGGFQGPKPRPASAHPAKSPWKAGITSPISTSRSDRGSGRPNSAPRQNSNPSLSKALVPVFDLDQIDVARKKNETPRSGRRAGSARNSSLKTEELALVPMDHKDIEMQEQQLQLCPVTVPETQLTPPDSYEFANNKVSNGADSVRSWGSWKLEGDGHYTPRREQEELEYGDMYDRCHTQSRGTCHPSVPVPKLRLELVPGTKPMLNTNEVKQLNEKYPIAKRTGGKVDGFELEGEDKVSTSIQGNLAMNESAAPEVDTPRLSKPKPNLNQKPTPYPEKKESSSYLKALLEKKDKDDRQKADDINSKAIDEIRSLSASSEQMKIEKGHEEIKAGYEKALTVAVKPETPSQNILKLSDRECGEAKKEIKKIEKVEMEGEDNDAILIQPSDDKCKKQSDKESLEQGGMPSKTVVKSESTKVVDRPSSSSSLASFFYESEYKASTGGINAPIASALKQVKEEAALHEKEVNQKTDAQLGFDEVHSIVSLFRMGNNWDTQKKAKGRPMSAHHLSRTKVIPENPTKVSNGCILKRPNPKRPQSAGYNPKKYTSSGFLAGKESQKFRFCVRILSNNGKDVHRDLVGYFFGDGSLTIYEFRKLAKKCMILPLIKRNVYPNMLSEEGKPYTAFDIKDGKDISFKTEEHNALPDYIADKTYVTFRVTNIDYEAKSRLLTGVKGSENKTSTVSKNEELVAIQKKVKHSFMKSGPSKLIKFSSALNDVFSRHAHEPTRLKNVFQKAVTDHNVDLNENEFDKVWDQMLFNRTGVKGEKKCLAEWKSSDADNEEFLRLLIGEMGEDRRDLVRKAFIKLDANKNGYLETAEVKKFICDNGMHLKAHGIGSKQPISNVPKIENTTKDIFPQSVADNTTLLNNFAKLHTPNPNPFAPNVDLFLKELSTSQGKRENIASGNLEAFVSCNTKISFQEFESYYEGISMSMEGHNSDEAFQNLLCNTWGAL